MNIDPTYLISCRDSLREYYKQPYPLVVKKQIDYLAPYGKTLIANAPFFIMATVGPKGLDCSPKGGAPGFVQIIDDKTLLIPDYAGNNRLDGLQNLIDNPAIGLMFMLPGYKEVYRVNGRAVISVDPSLCQRFAEGSHGDHIAKSVIVVSVEEAFIHCSKAISLAGLWDRQQLLERSDLPSIEEIINWHKDE